MINAFDIETLENNNILVPYCVCFYNKDSSLSFFGLNSINDFMEYIEKTNKNNIYIFSHNLTFDGSIILQNFNTTFKINGIFFKGNIYSLEVTIKDKKIIFKCSYKFFPTKLENAYLYLSTSKKLNVNHSLININNFNKYKKKIIKYCINDARIVFEIMSILHKIAQEYQNNWIETTYSISSLAIKIFENNFNNFNIDTYIPVDDDSIFRSSYFGGRCEVFGNPKNNDYIYHFDFSGMYAQIMQENFDYGSWEIIKNPSNITNSGFYYIDAYSNLKIPVLPHRAENKLLFTNGYISGLFWNEEIRLFMQMGGKILDIKYQLKFKNNEKIFLKFSQEFTNKRKISKQHNTFCKYIINSVYGRLGMTENITETKIFNKEKYEIFRKKKEHYILNEYIINNLLLIEYKVYKKNQHINSNVILASTITSKARIKLYRGFISTIKYGHGRLLYCDTDSIFASFKKNVDNAKFQNIHFDTKKNDTKIKNALFALPKAYSLEFFDNTYKTKIKGCNNINLNFKEFKKLFNNKDKKTIFIKILKKSNFIITPKEINKVIYLGNYNKRIFNDNFTETTPLFKNINNFYSKNIEPLNIAKYDNKYIQILNKLNINQQHLFKISEISTNVWTFNDITFNITKNNLTITILANSNIATITELIFLLQWYGTTNPMFEILNKSIILEQLFKIKKPITLNFKISNKVKKVIKSNNNKIINKSVLTTSI